jgi:hypothetical protein
MKVKVMPEGKGREQRSQKQETPEQSWPDGDGVGVCAGRKGINRVCSNQGHACF